MSSNARRLQQIRISEGGLVEYLEARAKRGYNSMLRSVVREFTYLGEAAGADLLSCTSSDIGGIRPRYPSKIGLYGKIYRACVNIPADGILRTRWDEDMFAAVCSYEPSGIALR